jgi:hypothetical protein
MIYYYDTPIMKFTGYDFLLSGIAEYIGYFSGVLAGLK